MKRAAVLLIATCAGWILSANSADAFGCHRYYRVGYCGGCGYYGCYGCGYGCGYYGYGCGYYGPISGPWYASYAGYPGYGFYTGYMTTSYPYYPTYGYATPIVYRSSIRGTCCQPVALCCGATGATSSSVTTGYPPTNGAAPKSAVENPPQPIPPKPAAPTPSEESSTEKPGT
jgi:hypothetical protein